MRHAVVDYYFGEGQDVYFTTCPHAIELRIVAGQIWKSSTDSTFIVTSAQVSPRFGRNWTKSAKHAKPYEFSQLQTWNTESHLSVLPSAVTSSVYIERFREIFS